MTEQDFFAGLAGAGVLIPLRLRYSTIRPEQVTGYAVACQRRRRDGLVRRREARGRPDPA